MDFDGNPEGGQFTPFSPLAAVGIMFLGGSSENLTVNYNWSGYLHWGPRKQGTLSDPFRPIGPWLAYPCGDANMYYALSRPGIDYDFMFTAIDHTSQGWLPPPSHVEEFVAWGSYLTTLSIGPFDLPPKQSINFTVAVVGGDNVHHDPTAFDRLFDPNHPEVFYNQLDFSELAANANWAKRVYDNPGVDTDGDGYYGEKRICNGDTTWYKGDGVPDFKADAPPPAPYTQILPQTGQLTIRFNGYYSETFVDPFTGVKDFEGYKVYCGLDERETSLSVLSSFDNENYNRYIWTSFSAGGRWVNSEDPFTLDSLRTFYADPEFLPLVWTKSAPYKHGTEHHYFTRMGFNQSSLTNPHGIRKVYPDATKPPDDPKLWSEDDLIYDYEKPVPKYYEYEYVCDNLLPTVPYFVSVTAFDFGFRGSSVPPQESNPLNNLQRAYAQTSVDDVESENLDVYVYPNPYRIDADYPGHGYENRRGDEIPDRSRRIHFANLPRVCTIHIFTLDGDRVRTIHHNYPDGGPEAMHDTWDLISRNVMTVESNLYYWVVESDTRTQIGKFAIIR